MLRRLSSAHSTNLEEQPDLTKTKNTGVSFCAFSHRSSQQNQKYLLTPAQSESSVEYLTIVCPSQDTFQDYQEMFVQFGYVVLFSSAFPLAAMCALINNIIEIRSDAFKLCTGLQRPFGLRVESIGQWQVRDDSCQSTVLFSALMLMLCLPVTSCFPQTVMEAMGLIAIIVNCYLIGQCGQLQRLFPWLSPEMAIISIVILEVQQLIINLRLTHDTNYKPVKKFVWCFFLRATVAH